MSPSNAAAPLAPWRPGQPLTRARINQLVDHANTLAAIVGGPGISITRTGNGVIIALDGPPAIMGSASLFPARLGASSEGAHAWTELQAGDGSWSTLPGGRTGTTSANAAYEINGRTAVPSDTLVWIMAAPGSDGGTRYTFDLGAGPVGAAASMTYSGQHADAAVTTTWDINSQASTYGVNLTVQTGSRYDPTAETPALYAYLRTLSFDANGQLTGISAESRVTLDTPESCP